MSVIFLLIAIGIVVAGGFLAAFIWSVKSGQYDDDYTPSVRMLFDNYSPDEAEPETTSDTIATPEEEAQSEKSNNNKS